MGLSEEIRQRLINSFKTEQAEHVQKINQGLLALEKNALDPDACQELLKEIFREAHSLKGAARAVGLTTTEGLGHALEEVLLKARDGQIAFSPELFDLLYQTLDAVELVLARVEAGDASPSPEVLDLLARLRKAAEGSGGEQGSTDIKTPAPSPQAPAPTQAPAPMPDETIRVSVNKLDALMGQFSELLGAKIRAEQRLAEVRQMQAMAAEWHKASLGLRSHANRLVRLGFNNGHGDLNRAAGSKDVAALLTFLATNQEQLRTFNSQANGLYRQLANDTLRLSLIIDELQEEIKRVRMLPLATITATFGRMVRDLAREQGKQINLSVLGGETELDKRVLEQIKDPLIHLLRNAVDHGIESPDARTGAGKEAEGQIELEASQQGNIVIIRVHDDGAGLDLAAIRSAVSRKGLLKAEEVEKLTDGEVADLIFTSGLSTSRLITDISGRGVGLDVVRQKVEELHGTLAVDFEAGGGTEFRLMLPLTLASSRGLLVQAGGQLFALPLTTVERMVQVAQGEVAQVEGQAAITYQGKPVALARLDEILELPAAPGDEERLTVVIVGVAEKRLGLIVDGLAGEQEIVMKSLGKQLAKIGGIAGATVLGTGQVILVLHAGDLVKLAGRQRSRRPVVTTQTPLAIRQAKTILVVDDSITTRTLEKNILEAAGYQIRLATDGEEALGLLVSERLPHLIISDINMPRLDGFGLTQRVKGDARTNEIPVILVTSLDSPADKARGIEVGADAYIVKSRFDQGNLLETIEQLV